MRTASGRVAVLIELRQDDSLFRAHALHALTVLGNDGVHLRAPEGRPIAWGRWVAARVDARGVAALRRVSFVAAVHLSPQAEMLPLERSAERLGLAAARAASRGPEPFTGAGVTIGDLDSAIDVFHPAFFRADAGYYDWIDVDGDGRLSIGVDAIDLDRDGIADAGETARALPASPIDISGLSTDGVRGGAAFDPSIDWVYLDLNRDGVRNFGSSAGFGDDDPAFGEPLFVPDDLDFDRVLDPEERLVRLGSSKIRSYYVAVGGMRPFEHVYRRGVDLATALRDYTGGAHGYADTLHGSGVAGILIGDVPLVGRRWVGIAPDADLVHAFDVQSDTSAALAWALGERPDVMLHEYVSWARVALDGSDPISQMIGDSTRSAQVAHICPAGNIGGARKHAVLNVAANANQLLRFQVDGPLYYVAMTIHEDSRRAVRLSLIEPNGSEHEWDPNGGLLSDGAAFWMQSETTSRGVRMRTYLLYSETRMIPTGTWAVRVNGDPTASTTVHGFLADENGFALGAAWDAAIATDRNTIAWPATADACLGVGSVPSHTSDEGPWYPGDERVGQVRSYSGRGPRIDGHPSLGIVAPDNPWSVLGAGDIVPGMAGSPVAPEGAFRVFGGTSGAGPHVAGVAALLAQQGIHGTDALATMRDTAAHDGIAGTLPNQDYGAGRLRASAALGVSETGRAPRAVLRAQAVAGGASNEVRLMIEASDPDGDALEVRWDDGYDGRWESGFGAVMERIVRVDAVGVHRWKARVRDATGRIAEAAAMIRVSSIDLPDAGSGNPDAGMGDAGLNDAGRVAPARDAGLGLDAGFGLDAGLELDGGTASNPDGSVLHIPGPSSSGCGCRVLQTNNGGSMHLGLLWMMVSVVVYRRRRAQALRSPSRSSASK